MMGALAGRPAAIEDAVALLEKGGLVLHPTETVYGIGGLLEGPSTARLRRAKGRRAGGFVVLVPGSDHVEGHLGTAGGRLARAFWPGPLTLVCDDPEGR
ncbi:MAG: Sua5/YciO/YrdC/YwlC family protein, partial [Gemmatimonadota bacterium]|nr:Sua5/YciO/YrdC/YwlC family protein [Gemmatimonadota bacterium]